MAFRRPGSLGSRSKAALGLFFDRIERTAPRLDLYSFILGGFFTILGSAVTWFHASRPGVALTEILIQWISTAIRAARSLLPLPVGDLATYAGLPFLGLGLALWLIRRINRWGEPI